jgi:aspartokinase
LIKLGGIYENRNLTLYQFTSLDDKPGVAGALLDYFAKNKINLEYITEAGASDDKAVMALCIASSETDKFDDLINEKNKIMFSFKIKKIENVDILGIYGPHFREKPAIAALFFRVLGAAGINVLGISTSISCICCVIPSNKLKIAHKALLKEFELP